MRRRSTQDRSIFVSFEGGEGAGKSTQIERLRARLEEAGCEVLVTREPGGSPTAERIRDILLSGKAKSLGMSGEAILFAAARRDHVASVIGPALRAGRVVLCDRFTDSTRVYQGAVAGADPILLDRLETAATSGISPDLTVMIDVPVEIGLERARARRLARGEEPDRFEAEAVSYHEKVRAAFLRIARAEPERCKVVDGSRSVDEVSDAIWSELSALLQARAGEAERG